VKLGSKYRRSRAFSNFGMKGGVTSLANKESHDFMQENQGCFMIFLNVGLFLGFLFRSLLKRSLHSYDKNGKLRFGSANFISL